MTTREGWGWPDRARVRHYFTGYASLCGKWQYGGTLYPLDDPGAFTTICAACQRKATKR
jgi:hypothetical protein